MKDTVTAYRTCPLCEATCGLELTIEAGQVSRIRGDAQDVFSHGFVCPKGAALKPLHEDPDRVRAPLVRTATGFEEVSWDDALGRGGAQARRRYSSVTAGTRSGHTSATRTRTTSMRSSTAGCC